MIQNAVPKVKTNKKRKLELELALLHHVTLELEQRLTAQQNYGAKAGKKADVAPVVGKELISHTGAPHYHIALILSRRKSP